MCLYMELQTYTIDAGSPVKTGCLPATVLLVDDDEHFRNLARQILEPGGFRVIEAQDVTECMSRIAAEPVGAIVLDIVMPGGDGIEAIGEMKKISPQTRIVTVSGAPQSELYLRLSAHLGADASLDKRDITALCALLDVMLDR